MLPLKATSAVFNFTYSARTSVLKVSKPVVKVATLVFRPVSAVLSFNYSARTLVLKVSRPVPKVEISPLIVESAVFNLSYSVITLALNETSLELTELVFPLTTDIFFSKLPISSGVATSLD